MQQEQNYKIEVSVAENIAIRRESCYQNLLATATSTLLERPGPVPVKLPSAIRRAQKSNRRSIHSTNPCIDPLWLEHLVFSTLAIDLSIYVKDKNSFTEKVNYGITSLGLFRHILGRLKLKAFATYLCQFGVLNATCEGLCCSVYAGNCNF